MARKGFVYTYFMFVCFILLGAAIHPVESSPVAVISAPWGDGAAEIVAKAGGRIVSTDETGMIVTSISDEPNFTGRLYRAGAMLVVSSLGISGCATPLQNSVSSGS